MPMEQTFATPRRVLVFVHNEVGLTAITGHTEETSHVSLSADTPGGRELVDRSTVECRSHGGREVVVVRVPRVHGMKFIRRNGVTVRVDVPEGSDVRVISASAEVELNGSLGRTNVKTASGALTVDDVTDLRAKTASGDIDVGTVGGALRMQSASGDLRCVRVDGPASVTTASGDVEVGSSGDQTEVKVTSGDVRLGDVSGDVTVAAVSGDVHVLSVAEGNTNIRSVSGKVEVGIARGATLRVDAESMSGTVRSEIPLDDSPAAGSGGAPRISLTLRSVSGDLLITRGLEAFV
jgi:DUF4097 and DUF4098 domain-containing protein YvlB